MVCHATGRLLVMVMLVAVAAAAAAVVTLAMVLRPTTGAASWSWKAFWPMQTTMMIKRLLPDRP